MNWFITTIGTILVLVLSAAVVGPRLVDWTAYRGIIAAQAERVLNIDVSIEGEADLGLLPTPRLEISKVRLGGPDGPQATAESVTLSLELAALLRGDIAVRALELEKPSLHLTIDADGRLATRGADATESFAGLVGPANVALDQVTATGLDITIDDARTGMTHRIADARLTGTARSLNGPFTIEGTAVIGGERHAVRLAGGVVDDGGRMSLSGRLSPENAELSVAFDGTAILSTRRPRIAGDFTARGGGDRRWSIHSSMAADTSIVTFDEARLSYGPEGAPLELTGEAFYALDDGEPLSVSLAAKHLDLDRLDQALSGAAGRLPLPLPLETRSGDSAPPAARILERLLHAVRPLASGFDRLVAPNLEATASLDVGTVLAGGALVRDVSAAGRVRNGVTELIRAEALFPGDAQLDLSGRFEAGFSGQVSLSASRPSRLARWWRGDVATGPVLAPLLLEADLDITGEVLAADAVSIRIGESSATGRVRFTTGNDDRATLDVAARAARLDAADAIAAARLLRTAGARVPAQTDILLDVTVDRLRLGAVDGNALTLDAVYSNDTLTLHALQAQDVGGARVFASGDIGALTVDPVGTIDGTVALTDGKALSRALVSLFPESPVVDHLGNVMPELAPGNLSVSLSGRAAGPAPALSMSVDGKLQGTTVALSASGAPFADDWRAHSATLSLEAANADISALARQVGLSGLSETGGERGAVKFTAEGVPASGLATALDVTAGEATASWQGDVTLGEAVTFGGEASLEIERIEDLAALWDRSLPLSGPVNLDAGVERTSSGALVVEGIRGDVDGISVAGALRGDAERVGGRLFLGAVDVAALSTLVLGPDHGATGDTGKWSQRRFGPR